MREKFYKTLKDLKILWLLELIEPGWRSGFFYENGYL